VLGTPVTLRRGIWTVRPRRGTSRRPRPTIHCGESGTTLRFLTAVAARSDRRVTLGGRGRLPQRPMEGLLRALRSLGTECRLDPRGHGVQVRGPLRAGAVSLDASVSSQFTSALLLVLPTMRGDSIVRLTGPIVSEPYLDATLAILSRHRVTVRRKGRSLRIPGGQAYRGTSFRPPGDASSAAYLWVAAAITGGDVDIRGLDSALPQADLAVLPLLESTGAEVARRRSGIRVRGRSFRPFRIDLTDAPDLYPLAGVLAASIPGRSRIEGAAHVALKESDRKRATADLARAFGARVNDRAGGLEIVGRETLEPVRVPDLPDHRLVMSAAVGALAARGESFVGEERAVEKSFHAFWTELARLTGGPGR